MQSTNYSLLKTSKKDYFLIGAIGIMIFGAALFCVILGSVLCVEVSKQKSIYTDTKCHVDQCFVKKIPCRQSYRCYNWSFLVTYQIFNDSRVTSMIVEYCTGALFPTRTRTGTFFSHPSPNRPDNFVPEPEPDPISSTRYPPGSHL